LETQTKVKSVSPIHRMYVNTIVLKMITQIPGPTSNALICPLNKGFCFVRLHVQKKRGLRNKYLPGQNGGCCWSQEAISRLLKNT